MDKEKNAMITYNGSQITFLTDGVNEYINLTEMAKAWKDYGRKSISKWLRNKQTIAFLEAWESKYNSEFDGTKIGAVLEAIKNPNFTLSTEYWISQTKSKGIFAKNAGTFAHKDIAIRFAAWLSPSFELFLVEKIQELGKLEKQKSESELLTHEEILELIKLKEVFKYVAHQEIVEDAHKDVFVSRRDTANPYRDYYTWRNKILDIAPAQIDERIKSYCKENNIALTKKVLNKSKREKILMFDSYETVRHAVWDFLTMKGEINALNLANLVRDIVKVEKGEILRLNETNLFDVQQDLGEHNDFDKKVSEIKEVKSAREVLAIRSAQKKQIETNLSDHNQKLKQALNYNPKDDKKGENTPE